MMSKAETVKIITDAVREVTDIEIKSPDTNLLGRDVGIIPADFLYIFDIVEKRTGRDMCGVIADAHYTIMTPNNLAEAIAGE